MAEVTIRDLRKSYGATEVIHGVDVAIADGQFVVLVGPSGCGKSTLLRMIAGLEGISGGTISIGDRVVNNLPPSTRDIAGSNYCHLGVIGDRIAGRAVVVAVLDNLTKGSSGQAIQNANLMLGIDETAGLMLAPVFP
jgi:ABC-type branched-subunit amino acid transport system ATPase component